MNTEIDNALEKILDSVFPEFYYCDATPVMLSYKYEKDDIVGLWEIDSKELENWKYGDVLQFYSMIHSRLDRNMWQIVSVDSGGFLEAELLSEIDVHMDMLADEIWATDKIANTGTMLH